MTGNRWGSSLLILLLLLAIPVAGAHAVNLYLYDSSVASDIDLAKYLNDGTLLQNGGKEFRPYVSAGPAPEPYPTIAISENSYEHLGASNVQIDGVVFENHGNFYVPYKEAIVLWTVRIPNASQRSAAELAEDLTLSLWIDWNQDSVWKAGERMIHYSFNLASYLPTVDDEIVVSYVTSFIVPDMTQILQANAKFGNSDKDIRNLWARALVAYDDNDASPDGAQLFGEYEDYRVAYYVQNKFADDGGSR